MLTDNRGVFLSLGARVNPALRAGFVYRRRDARVGLGVVWLFAESHTLVRAASVSLIIGGGFGNVLDRVLRSEAVTDFIFVWCGPFRTGVFNLADVFITTGVISLVMASLRVRAH